MTFFEKFMARQIDREAIFDYIEAWHKASSGKSLVDYLGLTKEQYDLFIMHPEKAEKLRHETAASYVDLIEKLS